MTPAGKLAGLWETGVVVSSGIWSYLEAVAGRAEGCSRRGDWMRGRGVLLTGTRDGWSVGGEIHRSESTHWRRENVLEGVGAGIRSVKEGVRISVREESATAMQDRGESYRV